MRIFYRKLALSFFVLGTYRHSKPRRIRLCPGDSGDYRIQLGTGNNSSYDRIGFKFCKKIQILRFTTFNMEFLVLDICIRAGFCLHC